MRQELNRDSRYNVGDMTYFAPLQPLGNKRQTMFWIRFSIDSLTKRKTIVG